MAKPSDFAWSTWSTQAFARAQAARRPVVLAVTVAWSEACRTFLQRLEHDPQLCARLAAHVVPVLVDAERRPDISERYAVVGWPTLVALNPVGTPLARLPTDVGRLGEALTQLLTAFDTRLVELAAATLPSPDAGAIDGALASSPASVFAPRGSGETRRLATEPLDIALELALASADRRFGGFGGPVKFPTDIPVRTCLAALTTRPLDEGLAAFVGQTLEAMIHSALWDRGEGGVFRAALAPDWSRVDPVKLLDANVALIDVYLDAARALRAQAFREAAVAIARFVRARLLDPVGGFFTACWQSEGVTVVDRTIRADHSARAVRCFLRLSSELGDPTWEADAIRTMERLVPVVYERGAGVAHIGGPLAEVRGLVADQIAMAAAAVDTFFVTHGSAYCDLAEELARSAWRKYWRPEWGLIDRISSAAGAGDMGLLARPLPAFCAGCEAAVVFERLARLTGAPEYHLWAGELWAWLHTIYARHGLDAGAYPLARLEAGDMAALDGHAAPRNPN